jgi:hypothetical protein
MKRKNNYRKKARISEVKIRKILKYFSMDLTATQSAKIT